jgi:hypothetical protein
VRFWYFGIPLFVFQNFDCEPRYTWFSIFLCLNVAFLFLHLSFCYFFLNNALGLLNPNLFKFFEISLPVPEILKKELIFAFYSAHTLLKNDATFKYIPCHKIWSGWDRNILFFAPKSWDPCHSSSKIVKWLVRKCQSCTNYNLGGWKQPLGEEWDIK